MDSKYKNHPYGIIHHNGKKVRIHFLHYRTEQEASEKWERRAKRVNFENLYVIGSEVDGCTDSDIEAFVKLPFAKKIFFSKNQRKRYNGSKVVFCIPEMNNPNFKNLYSMAHLAYKHICHQAKMIKK